jgi:hypothetical protein
LLYPEEKMWPGLFYLDAGFRKTHLFYMMIYVKSNSNFVTTSDKISAGIYVYPKA